MIVQFYIHNYATGSYEVCMYSTGTLNNGLVAVTNSIFTLEQVWCTTNHNLDSLWVLADHSRVQCFYYKPLAAITVPSYSKPCMQLGGAAQDDLGGGGGGGGGLQPPKPPP